MYSIATDVCGALVEVISGKPFAQYLDEVIFRPLGMTDTAFWVGDGGADRLAALYTPGPGGTAARLDAVGRRVHARPSLLSGGGGLVGSAADYHRFLLMLLGLPGSPAGELDGARLLSPRTVRYMARNHLPGGQDLESFGRRLYPELPLWGVGFGLGFAVVIDPVPGKVVCSPGEISWGGMASTAFWLDQAEELTVMFFTQLMPSSTYRIRTQLRQLVYQAVVD
jgi:CubicO group peptidase (beta-lactamase class C family)